MTDTPEIAISHLQRRKIEGRVLIPFIEVLKQKYGEGAVREVLDATIRRLASEDGTRWAETFGRDTASLRTVVQQVWAGGGAQEIEIVGESDDNLDFNVTRCRYAEFYQELGLAELGYRIHCNRDFAM